MKLHQGLRSGFHLGALGFGLLLTVGSATEVLENRIGRFDPSRDLFLAHFDSKTDVDDLHSIAGVATVLADPRFAKVNFHAVAGAYGVQDGLYVPSNELFELAFGSQWSDAHNAYDEALQQVFGKVERTLKQGGSIWIAEAGQSDFSADLARRVLQYLPGVDLRERFHIVQHSNWNEEVTDAEDLQFVQTHTAYQKIPDGNGFNNGTPGFRDPNWIDWKSYIKDARLTEIWEMALEIANRYNAAEGRYLNTAIQEGGMDFSDVVETCWIFGFEALPDAEAFFKEFAQ
ncbi:MAG: hypothetical protein ABQ298_00500 [Puniceicoccaceae bacterium]